MTGKHVRVKCAAKDDAEALVGFSLHFSLFKIGVIY